MHIRRIRHNTSKSLVENCTAGVRKLNGDPLPEDAFTLESRRSPLLPTSTLSTFSPLVYIIQQQQQQQHNNKAILNYGHYTDQYLKIIADASILKELRRSAHTDRHATFPRVRHCAPPELRISFYRVSKDESFVINLLVLLEMSYLQRELRTFKRSFITRCLFSDD